MNRRFEGSDIHFVSDFMCFTAKNFSTARNQHHSDASELIKTSSVQ